MQGETVQVQWDAYIYHGPGIILLEFSSDGGGVYEAVADEIPLNSADDAVGAFSWTTPAVDSSQCLMRVTYSTTGVYSDSSGPFTVGAPGNGGGEPSTGMEAMAGAIQDATLYEDEEGALANGAGDYLFAGVTQSGLIRRSLLKFDVAGALPAGVVVKDAALTVYVSRENLTGPTKLMLVGVASHWDEGVSDAPSQEGQGTTAEAGSATWIHASSPGTLWDVPGGDLATVTSASATISGTGAHTWDSTEQMVADVQSWLDEPSTNYGWAVIGDEDATQTAVRLNSKENGATETRPVLRIEYEMGGDVHLPGTSTLGISLLAGALAIAAALQARRSI